MSRNAILYPLAAVGVIALLYALYGLGTAEPVDVLPDRLSSEPSRDFDLPSTVAANLDAEWSLIERARDRLATLLREQI